MRERSTWDRQQIKLAATNRVADPYTMNQDHAQPAADAYVTGTPSDFAEDVASPNRWEEEYKGGVVDRNEIGMPEMRGETFNHPEKTASEAVLLKKADLCVKTARIMLGSTATEASVEDQAFGLMYLPDSELIRTFDRLAADEQEEKEEKEEPPAQQQKKQAEQQQLAQQEQLAQQVVEALQQGQMDQAKAALQQMVQQVQGCQAEQQVPPPAEQQQQAQQQMPQQMQAQQQGQQIAQLVSQMVQEALQQGQQAPAQQQQQQAQQQEQPVADDMLLDDMLAPEPMPNEMGIELEPAPMDVGEVELGPEDDVLRTLFAAEGQEQEEQEQQGQQQAQQQQQQKQAMTRTASTRTVGTRPTQGVSRVGGAAASTRDAGVDKLSALWPSAPDVSDVFGMRK